MARAQSCIQTGRPHSDEVFECGLETLTIEFDSLWLKRFGFTGRLDRSHSWNGGSVALAARRLTRVISNAAATEEMIGRATANFLGYAFTAPAHAPPSWLEYAQAALMEHRQSPTVDLARKLDLNSAWLARAYRAATGEGIWETLRRRRVEQACALLRRSDTPIADIAAEAGFCDQSHMNRAFNGILGRTPAAVRRETVGLVPIGTQ